MAVWFYSQIVQPKLQRKAVDLWHTHKHFEFIMGSYVIVMTKNKKTLIIHHSALAFVAKKMG